MEKDFTVSLVGMTTGYIDASSPEEAAEKILKRLTIEVLDNNKKEFTDFTLDDSEKLTLIKQKDS